MRRCFTNIHKAPWSHHGKKWVFKRRLNCSSEWHCRSSAGRVRNQRSGSSKASITVSVACRYYSLGSGCATSAAISATAKLLFAALTYSIIHVKHKKNTVVLGQYWVSEGCETARTWEVPDGSMCNRLAPTGVESIDFVIMMMMINVFWLTERQWLIWTHNSKSPTKSPTSLRAFQRA